MRNNVARSFARLQDKGIKLSVTDALKKTCRRRLQLLMEQDL